MTNSIVSKQVVMKEVLGLNDTDGLNEHVRKWVVKRNKEQSQMFARHIKFDVGKIMDMACKWCLEEQVAKIVSLPPANMQGVIEINNGHVKVLKMFSTK